VAFDSVGEHDPDELPTETLPDQVGPQAVADVERAGFLLDAGHPRLRSRAAEADELAAVVLHREIAEVPSQRAGGVVGGVLPRVVPAERALGLFVGQLPRAQRCLSRRA
jgi:hypothetical protein